MKGRDHYGNTGIYEWIIIRQLEVTGQTG